MNKRHYEHTLPNIRGSLSNTYGETAGTPPCGVCKGPVQKEPFSHVTDRLFMFLANIYPVLFYGSRVYV